MDAPAPPGAGPALPARDQSLAFSSTISSRETVQLTSSGVRAAASLVDASRQEQLSYTEPSGARNPAGVPRSDSQSIADNAFRAGDAPAPGPDQEVFTPRVLRMDSRVLVMHTTLNWLTNFIWVLLVWHKLDGDLETSWWGAFVPTIIAHLLYVPAAAVVMMAGEYFVYRQVGPPPPPHASAGLVYAYVELRYRRLRSHRVDWANNVLESLGLLVAKCLVCAALQNGTLPGASLRVLFIPIWVVWPLTMVLQCLKSRGDVLLGFVRRNLLFVILLLLACEVDGGGSVSWDVVLMGPFWWCVAMVALACALVGLLLAQTCQAFRARRSTVVVEVGALLVLLSGALFHLVAVRSLQKRLEGVGEVKTESFLLPVALSWLLMWLSSLVAAVGLHMREKAAARLMALGRVWTADEGVARRLAQGAGLADGGEWREAQRRIDKMTDEEVSRLVASMMTGKTKPGRLQRVGDNLYKRVAAAAAAAPEQAPLPGSANTTSSGLVAVLPGSTTDDDAPAAAAAAGGGPAGGGAATGPSAGAAASPSSDPSTAPVPLLLPPGEAALRSFSSSTVGLGEEGETGVATATGLLLQRSNVGSGGGASGGLIVVAGGTGAVTLGGGGGAGGSLAPRPPPLAAGLTGSMGRHGNRVLPNAQAGSGTGSGSGAAAGSTPPPRLHRVSSGAGAGSVGPMGGWARTPVEPGPGPAAAPPPPSQPGSRGSTAAGGGSARSLAPAPAGSVELQRVDTAGSRGAGGGPGQQGAAGRRTGSGTGMAPRPPLPPGSASRTSSRPPSRPSAALSHVGSGRSAGDGVPGATVAATGDGAAAGPVATAGAGSGRAGGAVPAGPASHVAPGEAADALATASVVPGGTAATPAPRGRSQAVLPAPTEADGSAAEAEGEGEGTAAGATGRDHPGGHEGAPGGDGSGSAAVPAGVSEEVGRNQGAATAAPAAVPASGTAPAVAGTGTGAGDAAAAPSSGSGGDGGGSGGDEICVIASSTEVGEDREVGGSEAPATSPSPATVAAAATASSADADAGSTCVICYDHEASCVFLECGHGGFCRRCAFLLFVRPPNECPTCRSVIDQVVEIEPGADVGQVAKVK